MNNDLPFPQVILIGIISCMLSCGNSIPADNQSAQSAMARDTSVQVAEYIVATFEDSDGNMWFGTMARGAVKYDGSKFTYLDQDDGIAGNTVASIKQDMEGNLWFGTHSGATRYDGETFTNYRESSGLHGPGCQILVDHKGQIWAATNHGVFQFHDEKFSSFQLPEPTIKNPSYKWEAGKIWSMIEDSEGNLWFGTDGYGAYKYSPKAALLNGVDPWTHFTKDDGLKSNNVSRVFEDREGNIWFGCLSSDQPVYLNEGGLSIFDGDTIITIRDVEGLFENDVYSIGEDAAGNVWICALDLGAYRFDGENFTLFNSTDRRDLIERFAIQGIHEDRKGNFWFGFSGGLFQFDGSMFVNVPVTGPKR